MAESEPIECLPVVELSRSEKAFWQRLVQHACVHEIDGCSYRFIEFFDEDNSILAHRLCDAYPARCLGDSVTIVPVREKHGDAKSPIAYTETSEPNGPCQHGRAVVYLSHARVSRARGRFLAHGDYLALWKDHDPPKRKRERKGRTESKKWKQTELVAQ